jgi:hypothetical protein
MHKWHLPASSGREEFSGVFQRVEVNYDQLKVILGDVRVSGSLWERHKEFSSASLVSDFSVSIDQMMFPVDGVEALIKGLGEWLLLEEQNPESASLEMGFALTSERYPGQRLRLDIDKRRDVITSIGQHACTIRYAGGAFVDSEWIFVIDQSCVRIFYEEIRDAFLLVRGAQSKEY